MVVAASPEVIVVVVVVIVVVVVVVVACSDSNSAGQPNLAPVRQVRVIGTRIWDPLKAESALAEEVPAVVAVAGAPGRSTRPHRSI